MDKVMVITGGGRGIGAETAKLAAKRGYAVCVNYLKDAKAAESLLEELSLGEKAIAVAGDVSREEDVLKIFAETDKALGRVTALVNNAGARRPLAARGRRSPRRAWRACRNQRHGQLPVRARGGEAHVDEARRQGRRDRQRLLGGGEARQPGRLRRLRRVEGGDRDLHRRARQGSGRRGHPRELRAAGCDPHRHPLGERRPLARRAHRRRRAARAPGRARGGRARYPLPRLGRGVLHDRLGPRCDRRP